MAECKHEWTGPEVTGESVDVARHIRTVQRVKTCRHCGLSYTMHLYLNKERLVPCKVCGGFHDKGP